MTLEESEMNKCGCGKQTTMLIQIKLDVCIVRCWICKDCYKGIETEPKVLFDFYPDGNPIFKIGNQAQYLL